MSESGIWPSRDWGSGKSNEATGGPGLYNSQVETKTIGPHPDNAFIPASTSNSCFSQTTSISATSSALSTDTELDMRTISLRTFFGVNASLTTSVPGRVSVSTRAQSMPLISQKKGTDKEMDVEMGDSTTSTTPKPRRAQSEYIIRIPHDEEMEVEETKPHVTHPPVIRRDCYNAPKSTLPEIIETPDLGEGAMDASITEDDGSSHAAQRALSPAATEVDDPESQDIIADIQTRGVKVKDFAYAPPYARPAAPLVPAATAGSFALASAPPSTPIPPENINTTYTTSTHTPSLRPVTEIFDPYIKITEVDYRWSQSPRTYPVTGKSLRRLLDMGWITPAELAARAAPMDLAALEAFDARKPVYPWRSIKWGGKVPGEGERRDMCNARKGFWIATDRMRERGEGEERRRKEEEERIGKAFNNAGGVKRAHDDDRSDEGDDVETKKRRITPEPSTSRLRPAAPQPPPSPPMLMPPAKQYPAPLHTYHPSIYPEAASIIESSSQSSSQPRPVFSPAPQRFDTPPVDEDGEIIVGKSKSQSNLDDEEAGELDDMSTTAGRGTKLVHPRERKKMARVLSRTQTFAQL